MPQVSPAGKPARRRTSPTYFFLRGLAIILPPIVTLLVLLWVAGGFNTYVIQPVNTVVRYAVASWNNQIRTGDELVPPPEGFPPLPDWQRTYRITPELKVDILARLGEGAAPGGNGAAVPVEWLLAEEAGDDVFVPMGKAADRVRAMAREGRSRDTRELDRSVQYVPLADYDLVFKQLRPQPAPTTPIGLYMEIATVRSFSTSWQLSALALSITIIALYFLGRLVTARIGAWFVHKLESVLTRVPLVRNVYSTVKQVTDFVITDREVEFKSVVALEYPRAGSWTLGFVTGEGMVECAVEVGEPMVTVLVPTSPMPMGGFTLMVPRSSVIDLNLTVDQAVQFIVSCGVLTPPQQRPTPEAIELEMRRRLERPATLLAGAAPAGDGASAAL